MVKNLPARRFPGVGNGNPLYNILAWKIPWTDWWATVQGIAKNQTQLSTGAQTYINTHTHTHTHTVHVSRRYPWELCRVEKANAKDLHTVQFH